MKLTEDFIYEKACEKYEEYVDDDNGGVNRDACFDERRESFYQGALWMQRALRVRDYMKDKEEWISAQFKFWGFCPPVFDPTEEDTTYSCDVSDAVRLSYKLDKHDGKYRGSMSMRLFRDDVNYDWNPIYWVEADTKEEIEERLIFEYFINYIF